MTPNVGTRARGTIVKVPDSTPGLLFANGRRRSFVLDGIWRSPVAPAASMTVDIELDDSGSIVSLSAVDPRQLARERLDLLNNIARLRGKPVGAASIVLGLKVFKRR